MHLIHFLDSNSLVLFYLFSSIFKNIHCGNFVIDNSSVCIICRFLSMFSLLDCRYLILFSSMLGIFLLKAGHYIRKIYRSVFFHIYYSIDYSIFFPRCIHIWQVVRVWVHYFNLIDACFFLDCPQSYA